jgi:hypothetical protein
MISPSVATLSRADTDALLEAAARLQLFVLAEAFDETDIALAHDIVASPLARDVNLLVGVNSRDLVTLKVVPGRLEQLAPSLPKSVPLVAETMNTASLETVLFVFVPFSPLPAYYSVALTLSRCVLVTALGAGGYYAPDAPPATPWRGPFALPRPATCRNIP